jgi:tight adherence protein D
MTKVNNYDGLISYYQTKVDTNPDDLTAYEQIALIYFEKGDNESAQFYTDYLFERQYKTSKLLALRAKIYSQEDDAANAIEAFNESILLGNTSGEVYNDLGVELSKQDQFEEAIAAFNTARLKGFDDFTIKNNLAVVYIAQGNDSKAIPILSRLLEAQPERKKVRSNLAIALIRSGELESAKMLLGDSFSDREIALVTQQIQNAEVQR